MPLPTRTAFRFNPLGDLGGSTKFGEPPLVGDARLPSIARTGFQCGLNAVSAQSSWKCADMPPFMLRVYLVSFFAAGELGSHGRDGLEPHSRLGLMVVMIDNSGTRCWIQPRR